ncbi:SDR family NAD(P)-dependent oxidoreductase, partial [Halorhodospira abdelmalekii]
METAQPGQDTLEGRVILITGAAEGVGRAVASACARAGASVVLSEPSETDVGDLYDEIKASGG